MRSAAVVGTGLIGTSIALALRGRGVTPYLLDVDQEAAHTAADLGAGVVGPPRAPVDLAIIAVPPQHVAAALREHQLGGLAHDFTDVASVKVRPQEEAALLGCDLTRFVGGHPMSGREQSGPLAAQADLFQGRPWVLTPSTSTRSQTVGRVKEVIELCGARPVTMAPDRHDRAVALVSHAPHMVASLLAGQLLAGEDVEVALAGPGLRDVTRIAGGSVELWTDILDANAAAVADVLTDLATELTRVVDTLRNLGEATPERHPAGRAHLAGTLLHGVQGRGRILTHAFGGAPLSGVAAGS